MKPGIKQLIKRSAVFLLILLVIRFGIKMITANPNIYRYIANEGVNLINKTNVTITLIFVLIAFALYKQKELKKIEPYKVKYRWIYAILSPAFLALYYVFRFYTTTSTKPITGITRLFLLGLFGIFLFLAVYGTELIKIFKKDLIRFSVLGVIYYFITTYVQYLWVFFVKIVSKILYFIFNLFYSNVRLSIESSWEAIKAGGGPTLGVNGFTARIGAQCSGIDSLLLFTSLYILIFILDHKRLKKPLTIALFFIGAIGIFLTNILRIFLLFLVGAHISPEIAVGLFHTNVGWILFIAYFFVFWLIASKYVYKKEVKKNI